MQKSIKYPKARNHYENDMWQSPVIGRDTPRVKEIFAYLIHLKWPHLRQLTFATAGAGGPQQIGVGGGQASKHGQRLRLPGT